MMDQVRNIYNLPPKELGPQDENVIECQDVSKEFNLVGRDGKIYALKEIKLKQLYEFYPIKRGEFVIIRVSSGGGKKTFQINGTIRLLGKEVKKFPKDSYLSELRLTTIGFVFQKFNLIATMTEYENVELPMSSSQIKKQKKKSQTTAKKCQFTGQNGSFTVITQLSGDEQYRVAIARSLANSPQILLFDKPKGDQDSKSTVEDMDTLLKLNNFGYDESNHIPCTMVIVTHNPDFECYAHRIIYIKDDKIEKMRENHHQDMNNICTILTVRTDCYKNQFMVEINRILINLQ